jgi:septal ring-binding cell division protein DamX
MPMSRAQVLPFLRHRLAAAGASARTLLGPDDVDVIHAEGHGIPALMERSAARLLETRCESMKGSMGDGWLGRALAPAAIVLAVVAAGVAIFGAVQLIRLQDAANGAPPVPPVTVGSPSPAAPARPTLPPVEPPEPHESPEPTGRPTDEATPPRPPATAGEETDRGQPSPRAGADLQTAQPPEAAVARVPTAPGPAVPETPTVAVTAAPRAAVNGTPEVPEAEPGPTPRVPVPAPDREAGRTPVSKDPDGLLGIDWIKAQDPEAYVAQVLAVASEDALRKFVRSHPMDARLAYLRVPRGQGTWHTLLAGPYPSREAAEAAVAALPSVVRANEPWIRRLGPLQDALPPAVKR